MSAYGREIMGASDVIPVTKADADLPDGVAKGLLIGTAGTLNVKTENGNIRTALPVIAGYNNIRVSQVRTGGTATDIFALY